MLDKIKQLFVKPVVPTCIIGAPVAGEAVPLSDVAEAIFAQEIIGKGAAIHPTDGKIYSPVDGKVQTLFDTTHAVSIRSAEGAEILIHIGMDTIKLQGEHFTAHTHTGAQVKKGDLLIACDFKAIRSKGFDIITPVVICNYDQFAKIHALTGHMVRPQDPLLELIK